MKKIGVIGLPGSWSSEELADAVYRKTAFRLLMDIENISLDLEKGSLFYKDVKLEELDAIVIKKINKIYSPISLDRIEVLRYLEDNFHGRIFSRPSSIFNLINRLSCTVTLRKNNIPIPETVITESIEEAVKTVERFGKCVFKPLYTSKARGMTVVCCNEDIRHCIEKFQENNTVMYIQKMIEPLEKDLGITFIGGKYIGTYARVKASCSWNTTTNSGGKYEAYEPQKEIIELAVKAQSLFDLDFTCVDIAETKEGPTVFEVSAFGGFKGLLEANQISAADLYVDYILECIS